MRHVNKMAAVAVSAAMVAACSAPGTTNGNGLTDTIQGDSEVAGMVVMDPQAVNDLVVEFNTLRTEMEAAASPALTNLWNVLEIQMANLVVAADTGGGVPQDVIDDARDAVNDVTAAIQAEGDSVTESLSAAWNSFVNRFETLTS